MIQIKKYFNKINLNTNIEIFNKPTKRASISVYYYGNSKGDRYNLGLATLKKEMNYFVKLTKDNYFLD